LMRGSSGFTFRVSAHPYVGKVSAPFWLNV
jgi:hypothetical protein